MGTPRSLREQFLVLQSEDDKKDALLGSITEKDKDASNYILVVLTVSQRTSPSNRTIHNSRIGCLKTQTMKVSWLKKLHKLTRD